MEDDWRLFQNDSLVKLANNMANVQLGSWQQTRHPAPSLWGIEIHSPRRRTPIYLGVAAHLDRALLDHGGPGGPKSLTAFARKPFASSYSANLSL